MAEQHTIEAMARAMWARRRANAARDGLDLEEWGDGSVPRANGVFDEALDALKAMREPTETMVLAGVHHDNMGDMAGRWNAMIDAAIAEGSI